MKVTRKYASDVTDKQWQILRRLLPERKRRGRPPIDRRRMINAILYVVRSGCQWRMLPSEFPKWSTVYGVFWKWNRDGTWRRIHDALREKSRFAPPRAALSATASWVTVINFGDGQPLSFAFAMLSCQNAISDPETKNK